MWSFFLRGFILLFLFFLGLAWGWEFMFAGLIFMLMMAPPRPEYLFLGLGYDLLFSFPTGFFTVTLLLVIFTALTLARFFKEDSFSSLLTRLVAAAFTASLAAFFFFLKSFWPALPTALKFASLSFVKILLPLLVLAILFKVIELSRGQKIFSK